MNKLQDLRNNLDYIRPAQNLIVEESAGFCDACGGFGPFQFSPIITDKLANEWSLNKKEQHAFSSRESMFCVFCGCSYRLRALAKAIVIEAGKNPKQSLKQLISKTDLQEFSIAEINSAGVLHDILRHSKKLTYSEYCPVDKSVEHQDLHNLTYKDNSFDIVLTSDTFEHVPDYEKALGEIYRVLKTGGKHIFTVPMRTDKKTKNRTVLQNGKPKYIEKKSYHGSGEPDYLVWNEFGGDFIHILEKVGFSVQLYFQNTIHLEDPSCVIVAGKLKSGSKPASQPVKVDMRYSQPNHLADLKRTYKLDTKTVDIGIDFDEQYQLKKVGELANKVRLTGEHAKNVEDISKSYFAEIEKLRRYIESQNTELKAKDKEIAVFNSSLTGKVYRSKHAIKRKITKG